ncbi:nicotinamide-nucleotide amidase [Trichlorobacter thiogenes]|uniref:Nicotinamide-nucleotide amidase n=2 Tax=Trichlorobacter thiogenes TaxID=115783 RepID=A0A1T4M465_9BACT|nr:nicotinamide-nucleotide amidase [Trichlorobacter thiogenes]
MPDHCINSNAGRMAMTADQELAGLFLASGMTLAMAESCTGGMIAARVTDSAGCSAWFRGGVVAYSNEVKQQLLQVSGTLLEQYGAVSEAVARAMAEGARRVIGSDLALAVTGIAGPEGGTSEKPVGTVYIALADQDGCEVVRCQFNGNRAAVRQQTVEMGLLMLKKRLMVSETA